MSKIIQLASGKSTAADTLLLELVEADETPAVVIVRWPVKATMVHPRRFPDAAAAIAAVGRSRNSVGRDQREAAAVMARADRRCHPGLHRHCPEPTRRYEATEGRPT
jgi:hypothetical protein